jgi:hydrogenase maturation protease
LCPNTWLMKHTLLLGYGNADREDDGVAWHILNSLALLLSRSQSESPEVGFESGGENPELLFTLQLTPEMSETIAGFERVCFIDAHTGSVPGDLHIQEVVGEFQNSPFTHHLTPATCLSFCEHLYGRKPEAILISVRGYQFGFRRGLSPLTESLAQQAADQIWEWLQQT